MTSITAVAPRGPDSLILRTAARGAALIGAAVVLGIVLLQVVDDGGTPGGTPGNTSASTPGSVTTTTQAATFPADFIAQVLNGSGLTGAAGTVTNTLRTAGVPVGNPADTTEAQGTTVYCKDGLDDQAARIAQLVGTENVAPMPDPLPQGADPAASCLVVIGK